MQQGQEHDVELKTSQFWQQNIHQIGYNSENQWNIGNIDTNTIKMRY